jgi:hypothetical protein
LSEPPNPTRAGGRLKRRGRERGRKRTNPLAACERKAWLLAFLRVRADDLRDRTTPTCAQSGLKSVDRVDALCSLVDADRHRLHPPLDVRGCGEPTHDPRADGSIGGEVRVWARSGYPERGTPFGDLAATAAGVAGRSAAAVGRSAPIELTGGRDCRMTDCAHYDHVV